MSPGEAAAAGRARLDEASALALIRQKLADELGIDPAAVTAHAHLQADLALDSLDVIELLTMLEDEVGVPLGPEIVSDHRRIATVGALAALVCEVSASAAAVAPARGTAGNPPTAAGS